MKDTARVLGRMYDAIEYRGAGQGIVEELARYAGVPVFNGLTDEYHPTQMLADVLTMTEHSSKPLHDIAYAYVGDGRNNMANSLLLVGAKLGMDVRIGAPRRSAAGQGSRQDVQDFAKQSGARITITDDPKKAVKGVDFIHTDVWVSMGEPIESWAERIDELMPFQVNSKLVAAGWQPRCGSCTACRPSTTGDQGGPDRRPVPEARDGIEVTEEVFESPVNICFEQAENRMHIHHQGGSRGRAGVTAMRIVIASAETRYCNAASR